MLFHHPRLSLLMKRPSPNPRRAESLRYGSGLVMGSIFWLLAIAIVIPIVTFGQDASPTGEVCENGSESKVDAVVEQISDAERIAELQDTIEEDREQLAALETEIDSPSGEYALAEKAFTELKTELEMDVQALEEAQKASDKAKVESLLLEIASKERQQKLAESRFELAIEDRRTLREQIHTLRGKLKKDQAALDELTGEGESDAEPMEESVKASEPDDSDHTTAKLISDSKSSEEENVKKPSEEESKEAKEEKSSDSEEPKDEEIAEAENESEAKEQEAEEAQRESQSLADRIADLQKLVAQEQKELSLGRKKMELAESAQFSLAAEITKRQSEKADEDELRDLRTDVNDAGRRLILARSEVNAIVERLNDHRAELGMLQSEHIVALHEAENKRQEAEAAEHRLDSLRNPFAPRNILQWLLDHGIRLIAIVVGMFFLNRIAAFFSQRSISLVSAGTSRGTKMERENRARTLVGVFQNAATVAIFITGFLMILEEVGANVTVLMGGVAVIGLAVAFGAQNLIKDYFYGFVMLLENQYMLNDSIRIGTLTGQVERITLRMTVLRDSNGVVHFVPNGTIESVSNETHGWSRAVCEIAIGYDEDLDHVLEVLREIGENLKCDAKLGAIMLEAPTQPAIEVLGESSIRLKISCKTLPNKHGVVKQEWLLRVHRRFAELGIQPAYPQQRLRIDSVRQEVVSAAQHRNRPAA